MLMKKLWIVCLLCLVGLHLGAQDIVYSSLKDLLAKEGNPVGGLKVEKRSKNQITLSGGADYRIMACADKSMCKELKDRYFAVRIDTSLYVNCKKLRYQRLRFGGWYAPAMILQGNVFFSAIPLGSVAANSSVTMDVTLGGTLGDAIAASGLVSKRVYYEIDAATGKVDFVGKERMATLLEPYPNWQKAYLEEDSESADATEKYLQLLKNIEK